MGKLHQFGLRRAVWSPGDLSESHLRLRKTCFSPESLQARGVNVPAKPISFPFAARCASRGNIDYPRIQILSIAELLRGEAVKMPPQFGTFKQAQRVQQSDAGQPEL